jgi:hypothetical protein
VRGPKLSTRQQGTRASGGIRGQFHDDDPASVEHPIHGGICWTTTAEFRKNRRWHPNKGPFLVCDA